MGITVDEVLKEGLVNADKEWSPSLKAIRQTLRELGRWNMPFILAHTVIATLPLLSSFLLGATIDALIGARGVGVMTSELTSDLWRFGTLLLVVFACYIFTAKFSGQAAQAGSALVYLIALTCLVIGLVLREQWEFALVTVALQALLSMFGTKLWLRFAWLTAGIVAAIIAVQSVLQVTISRSSTVGEGLAIIALIVWSIVLLKLRLIRPS